MAAGLAAIALEVNPNLSWRDMQVRYPVTLSLLNGVTVTSQIEQHIFVHSTSKHNNESDWQTNGAGLQVLSIPNLSCCAPWSLTLASQQFSHKFGFGLLNAEQIMM